MKNMKKLYLVSLLSVMVLNVPMAWGMQSIRPIIYKNSATGSWSYQNPKEEAVVADSTPSTPLHVNAALQEIPSSEKPLIESNELQEQPTQALQSFSTDEERNPSEKTKSGRQKSPGNAIKTQKENKNLYKRMSERITGIINGLNEQIKVKEASLENLHKQKVVERMDADTETIRAEVEKRITDLESQIKKHQDTINNLDFSTKTYYLVGPLEKDVSEMQASTEPSKETCRSTWKKLRERLSPRLPSTPVLAAGTVGLACVGALWFTYTKLFS